MKILCVVHAEFEKPGSIETWAKKSNHLLLQVNPFKGEMLPDIDAFDLLVVMGGPQSPLELDKAPYLRNEIELIKQAISKGKRILGVCLGAQLIGEALGAKTERSPNREVGMYPVQLLNSAKDDPVFSQFSDEFDVMHWHSDMPGMVEGMELLAQSEGCPRQVFRYGDKIYGFQCHFELTRELVKEMIRHCEDDLKPGKYVMTQEQLMEQDYSSMNAKMDKVLDYLSSVN